MAFLITNSSEVTATSVNIQIIQIHGLTKLFTKFSPLIASGVKASSRGTYDSRDLHDELYEKPWQWRWEMNFSKDCTVSQLISSKIILLSWYLENLTYVSSERFPSKLCRSCWVLRHNFHKWCTFHCKRLLSISSTFRAMFCWNLSRNPIACTF